MHFLIQHYKHVSLVRKTALLLAVTVLAVFLISMSVAPLPLVSTLTAVLVITFFSAVFLLSPRWINEVLSAWILVISALSGIVIAGYMVGGLQGPVLLIMPIVPVLSVLLIGGRNGWIILALSIFIILVFIFMHLQGHTFPSTGLSREMEIVLRGCWLIICIAMVMTIFHYFAQENDQLKKQLMREAATDHLTGLANRRTINDRLAIELERCRRNSTSTLSILLLDIDYFKKYNDTFGHQAGDDCLVHIAAIMRSQFRRAVDEVGRMGGEEFIVILPDTGHDRAVSLADTLRQAIEAAGISSSKTDVVPLTVTIGVACSECSPSTSTRELISNADKALYAGKSAGRNRVVSAESL